MDGTRVRIEAKIHETAEHGRVLEFVITGAHQHDHPQCAELIRSAAKELENEIVCQRAKAIIINLLGFDYSFGDEIGVLFLHPYMVLARTGGGKIAVVASGHTAACLDSLFKHGHLDLMFGATRQDLASALEKMTEIRAWK